MASNSPLCSKNPIFEPIPSIRTSIRTIKPNRNCTNCLLFEPIPKFRTIRTNRNVRRFTKTYAVNRETHDQNFSGKLVDKDLIVLRKRIHEMKMIERNYEAPMEWMKWEKQIYTSYDSIVCDAMRVLQSFLMETRPSLALGMIALITLSVPISSAVVMFNLLEISKVVLRGIHLG